MGLGPGPHPSPHSPRPEARAATPVLTCAPVILAWCLGGKRRVSGEATDGAAPLTGGRGEKATQGQPCPNPHHRAAPVSRHFRRQLGTDPTCTNSLPPGPQRGHRLPRMPRSRRPQQPSVPSCAHRRRGAEGVRLSSRPRTELTRAPSRDPEPTSGRTLTRLSLPGAPQKFNNEKKRAFFITHLCYGENTVKRAA